MAYWSAENATNAYLTTIRVGKRTKEPEAAEFISALVAGINAHLIIVACANEVDESIVIALSAAAHQTGGRVICILRGAEELALSTTKKFTEDSTYNVEFVEGDAQVLITSEYREADCILIDCRIKNCQNILKATKGFNRNTMIMGYNALCLDSLRCSGFDGHFLPIGDGLILSRGNQLHKNDRNIHRRGRWVVKVDKITGEEHFYRILT